MRLRFWRCARPTPPTPVSTPPGQLPRRTPNERPTWATAPTRAFPMNRPGCPGRLTRAQEWRANGGRWSCGPEGPR
ncbi:hypothetical protein [Micromonospora thermarum]|uniref:Uncharacterized protein n=1 Tax=Micromonospora thermarum TaxID=2720024 RepID=A0ABX0ZDT5_9ACTN|nr:hypothetical protein [Micromonospora thermarum]NJP34684.1 hypothetical protein [Micromonospora thermarum]